MVKQNQQTIIGYIGTYTKGNSKGIYRFTLDTVEGKISTPVLAAELTDPTYITISEDNKHLYAILKEAGSGGVSAYSINEDSSDLTYLGKQLTPNGSSCHISIDSEKHILVTSNYGDGIIEAYQLQKDATLYLYHPLSAMKEKDRIRIVRKKHIHTLQDSHRMKSS